MRKRPTPGSGKLPSAFWDRPMWGKNRVGYLRWETSADATDTPCIRAQIPVGDASKEGGIKRRKKRRGKNCTRCETSDPSFKR